MQPPPTADCGVGLGVSEWLTADAHLALASRGGAAATVEPLLTPMHATPAEQLYRPCYGIVHSYYSCTMRHGTRSMDHG